MKSFLKNYKKKIATAFLAVAVVTIGTSQAALIPLGSTAATFAVLGGSTVTNTITANTIINGNVGLYPGPSISGFALPPANTVMEGPGSTGLIDGAGLVTGTIYISHEVAQQAQSEVTTTYDSLAGMTSSDMTYTDLTSLDLGTLAPLTAGIYHFDTSAQLTGTLTLTGTGNFVFQIGSTLTTATDSSVLVTGGANAGNVYWQVGASATLGTGTDFVGNILALASIGFDGGGTLDGRALARTGAVTITTAENINVPTNVPEPATLCLLGLGALSLIRRKK